MYYCRHYHSIFLILLLGIIVGQFQCRHTSSSTYVTATSAASATAPLRPPPIDFHQVSIYDDQENPHQQQQQQQQQQHHHHRRKLAGSSAAAADNEDEPQLWIIQFNGPVSNSDKSQVESILPTKLRKYIPSYSFVVSISSVEILQSIQRLGMVRQLIRMPEEAKLTRPLHEYYYPHHQHHHHQQGQGQRQGHRRLLVELSPPPTDLESDAWTMETCEILLGKLALPGSSCLTPDEVEIKPPITPEMMNVLLRNPSVFAIERDVTHTLKNHVAQGLVQSRISNSGDTNRPLWDRGIRGQGQIVGVADTGLDLNNCLFRDSHYPEAGEFHRKVIFYDRGFGDMKDSPAGHGTHVAASVAGSVQVQVQVGDGDGDGGVSAVGEYAGLAPDARLVFHDMRDEGSSYSGLSVPWPMDRRLFQISYDRGVRIHSNSWGCGSDDITDCNRYTIRSRSVDQYSWDNPDFLILFAAGNDGQSDQSLTMSIGAPATAKNTLSVGASQTTNVGFATSVKYRDWTKIALERGFLSKEACCAFSSTWKRYCCESTKAAEMYRFPGDYNEENVAQFSSRGPTSDGRLKPELVAPGEFIVSGNAQPGGVGGCSMEYPSINSSMSSLISKKGTSMATPIMAGGMALIRQYFMDGWYNLNLQKPNVRPNPDVDSIQPTSALLKAVAANGAYVLTGILNLEPQLWPIRNDVQLGSVYPPSVFQGFGSMHLETTLPFVDSQRPFHWYISFDKHISTNETHHYCITPPPSPSSSSSSNRRRMPMTIMTLVWTDYPAQVTAKRALVNNLDLVVGTSPLDVEAGNYKIRRDGRNNMEQILWVGGEGGDDAAEIIQVMVRGYNVPMGPQTYALVISQVMDDDAARGNVAEQEEFNIQFGMAKCSPFPLSMNHFNETTDDDHFPTFSKWEIWQIILLGIAAGFVWFLMVVGTLSVCCYWRRDHRPPCFFYYMCWPCNACITQRRRNSSDL